MSTGPTEYSPEEAAELAGSLVADAPRPADAQGPVRPTVSRGFWGETWVRFRRRKLAMVSLLLVLLMGLVAIFSPAIAGTRPVVCKYKGRIYFPCLAYFNPSWENAVFYRDKFRKRYPHNLQEKDPDSWALWPLVYQDPYRRVRDNEFPGQKGNPYGDKGKPYLYYLFLRAVDGMTGSDYTKAAFGSNDPPNPVNLMGTSQEGVDVFAMMVHGTRVALLVGFVATGIAAAIGIVIGALAGYFRGWVDILLSRVIELVMCIPSLVLILALIAVLEKPTIWHVMAVIGVTSWTGIARLTRGEFLKLGQSEFVLAAQSLGAGGRRIMFRHILPNALAPVMVPICFGIAAAILIETGLSFLGFGTPPPNPSWGKLLSAGRANYQMWWLIFFPGLAIFFTVLAYNLIGEGLQEATDPRLREAGK